MGGDYSAIAAIGKDHRDGIFNVGGMTMANNIPEDDKIKNNPLSNANLPGGLWTHPGVC